VSLKNPEAVLVTLAVASLSSNVPDAEVQAVSLLLAVVATEQARAEQRSIVPPAMVLERKIVVRATAARGPATHNVKIALQLHNSENLAHAVKFVSTKIGKHKLQEHRFSTKVAAKDSRTTGKRFQRKVFPLVNVQLAI
jgi:hypothetical protein